MLGRAFLRILGMPQIDAHPQDSWKYEDHAEFPFSTGSVHTKVSSDEAAASSIWEAAQDARIGNKSEEFIDESCRVFDDSSRDFVDTDDESYDEYLDTFENAEVEIGKTSSKNTAQCRIILPTQEHNPTSLPNLPDQNVCNASVRGKTLSAQLIGWHSKVEKANLHLFDDRVFIAEDKADAEKVLKMNTTRNPIARMINPLMANVLKIFDYEVHAFRAVFNILFWKDPMLSYWAMGLVCCLIIFVLIFPWRLFFFVVGLFGLGPQNYFLVDWYHYKSAMQEPAHEPPSSSTKSLNTHYKSELVNSEEGSNTPPEGSTGNGHLLNNSPLLLRNNIQMKPDGKLRKVIVPSIPFRHNRFYDWPPDPNLITIR